MTETAHEPERSPLIGVFDSGVGGLSVLPALRQALPSARLLYVADSGHAPYGERPDDYVQARCIAVANFLREQEADLMVMACNTATAAAADRLRAEHPDWPIVGIEPGIKPAALVSRTGHIGVMATRATLNSPRFARLVEEHAPGVRTSTVACTGLAWAIEQGDDQAMDHWVRLYAGPWVGTDMDVVVLGCTHYPFVADRLSRLLGPSVRLLDTAMAVALRAAHLARLHQLGPLGSEVPSLALTQPWRFWTTGDPQALAAFARRWLDQDISVQPLPPTAGVRA